MFSKLFVFAGILLFIFSVVSCSQNGGGKKKKFKKGKKGARTSNFVQPAEDFNSSVMNIPEFPAASNENMNAIIAALNAQDLSSASLSSRPTEFVLEFLEGNLDTWIMPNITEVIPLLRNEAVLERFGLRIMNLLLGSELFHFVSNGVLYEFVMPLTDSSPEYRYQMFQAALDYKRSNTTAAILNSCTRPLIQSVVQFLKRFPSDVYAPIFQQLINDCPRALDTWEDVATASGDFFACFFLMKMLPELQASLLAMFIFQHFKFVPPFKAGPQSCQTMFQNYIQSGGVLTFETVLTTAFLEGEWPFIKAAIENNYWGHFNDSKFVATIRKLKYDQETHLPVRDDSVGPLLRENSLLWGIVENDEWERLVLLLGKRFQCEDCMLRNGRLCLRHRHFLTAEEEIELYELIIKKHAKDCLKVVFSGLFEWSEKVRGKRFLPYAFGLGEYQFAMEMMRTRGIPINLTDTPGLNPGGDLLLYAMGDRETFAELVRLGANVNVRLLLTEEDAVSAEEKGQIITLVCYLLRHGQHEMADLLISKGARFTREEILMNASLSRNPETIAYVQQQYGTLSSSTFPTAVIF